MSWKFEHVMEPIGSLTEGPVWNGKVLLFTDIEHGRVLRFAPDSRAVSVHRSGTNEGNGLALDTRGRLYCCEGAGAGRRVARYNDDGTTDIVADQFMGKRFNSPNDLCFDAAGRLWFSDPRYSAFRDDLELDHESVYRCEPLPDGTWKARRMTYDATRPNGIAISPDDRTLYVAQSKYGEKERRELRAYQILDDGSLGQFVVLHDFYPHRGIDGMCLDRDGNIVATAGWAESGLGPMIYVFTPDGRIVSMNPLPVDRPTNCCFGDEDLRSLYVTTVGGHLLRARVG